MDLMVNKQKLKIRLALVTFLVYFLNTIATKFYWYYSIWWFDVLMHFLGGVWVTFILFWFFPVTPLSKNYFPKLILGILFVGLGWEVFEIIFNNIIAGITFDLFDTLSDVFFDMLGGVLAVFYFSKRIMIKSK